MPLPMHIDREQFETLPDSPGVYYFRDQNNTVIYIGKSIHIKQRVLSHFYASNRVARERKLAMTTYVIEHTTTAGELSALLLESREVKRLNPLFNRRLRQQRALYSWRLPEDGEDAFAQISKAQWPPPPGERSYGLYRSHTQAKQALLDLARKHQLCCQQLGLEASSRGCFNLQLNRCLGACIGRETPASHKQRTVAALALHDNGIWPYPSAIALREHGASQLAVFDRWFFLGEADSLEQAERLCDSANGLLLDRDSYRILLGFLKRNAVDELIVLTGRDKPTAQACATSSV